MIKLRHLRATMNMKRQNLVLPFLIIFVMAFHLKSEDLRNGTVSPNAAKFQNAYLKNPADLPGKMAYAQVAPCSTAIRLYTEVTKSETATDSIKSQAFCKLGDYHYALKEYSVSVDNYRQATKLSSLPVYRHKWALASMAAGDNDAAQSLWHTLSLEFGDEHSQMANYYLGLLQIKKGNFQDALNLFAKSGNPDPKKYWTIASLAGKLECASRLGMVDKVKSFSEQLKPYQKNLLERDLFEISASDSGVGLSDSKNLVSDLDSMSASMGFTLQVGAFGSVDNAWNLQKKLSKEFRNVTVVGAKPGEQVIYRVRIGSFASREEALGFAADSLVKAGLKFTIVED
ncbi:MAG TPA: SPOR domain-containing protein [Chitinispirillaceae bacterium]|nr:SPOR domain-containing protein [Chitinispirillaceae bacterium]